MYRVPKQSVRVHGERTSQDGVIGERRGAYAYTCLRVEGVSRGMYVSKSGVWRKECQNTEHIKPQRTFVKRELQHTLCR